MKKLTLSLILLTSLLTANNLAWVDERVDAIKPARDGESNSAITRIKDPFIFLEKNGYSPKEVKETILTKKTAQSTGDSLQAIQPNYKGSSFTLGMIMNNSALINGKWFKVGDLVNRYKIIKISKSSVTLKQKSKIKTISTVTQNSNLKFKR